MSAIPTVNPALVPLFAFEIGVEQYFSVAILALLVYHTVLRLEEEVAYFWGKPCNLVGIIFFVNKYAGILGAVCNIIYNCFTQSLASCEPYSTTTKRESLISKIGMFSYWTSGITNLANVLLIDYILTIRVLALYDQDRRLNIFLLSILAVEGIFELGLLVYSGVADKVFIGGLGNGMIICLSGVSTLMSLDILSWAVPMVYGLILLVLSLYKATEYWKMSKSFKAFPLVKVLIEDQVIYYLFVITCCVLRLVVRTNEHNFFVAAFINSAGNPSFLSVLGSYLLINLKKAGEKGMNGGAGSKPQTASSIVFA